MNRNIIIGVILVLIIAVVAVLGYSFLNNDIDCISNDRDETDKSNENYDFVKSTFERAGGRVTELVAKPLLELLFPDNCNFSQPLSGIIAGKKEKFDKIELEKDYGVDIGILLDMIKMNAKIKEVNIGTIDNCSQSWKSLSKMSKQVMVAILKRANTIK